MKKIDLALCDQDTRYITAFASYLLEHYVGVEIHIFTTPESFFADSKDFNLAIMTEDFVEVSSFKQSGSIAKKYVLTETENDELENHIIKYQSMECILSAIPEISLIGNKVVSSVTKSNNSNIVGVYSPICHELQLPFSMALGQSLKDKGSVLFLDFEELSIMPELIGTESDRNLSDLLYEVSTDYNKLKIEEYIHQFMGFDYINPFSSPDEICLIDEETWKKFFERVERLGYDNVVVLFGRTVNGFSELISKLDTLYVLGKPGDYFRRGQEAFMKYVKNIAADVNTREVFLPMSAANLTEGTYCIEELLQGNLGLFVKRELVVA